MNRGLKLLVCAVLFLVVTVREVFCQKKWDGGGGNNQWINPLNWNDDQLPSLNDSILLDNSLVVSNYSIFLPSSNTGVAVHSVRISPSMSSSIQLIIPVDNLAVPALSMSGQPGLVLESGAIFQNSSGATSGTVVSLIDSIYVLNGARFIQNSRTAHALYSSRLSRMSGTERGVFEFNVPGTASYTISLAGRTYGDLELNANAAGGTKTYLSNGSNPALIRGKLSIQQGANFALDFTGEIQVKNDLVVAGILNLSSSVNSNQLKLMGDLFSSGLITESGTGLPVLNLAGLTQQSVWQTGTISNQVSIRTNNTQSVKLRTNLHIPYLLELISGKLISTDTSMIVIASGAGLLADSTLGNCFVDGPIKKLGLVGNSSFLFPVGKGSSQRWVALKNASGDFEVEFFKQSANSISGSLGTGLDHVSSIEFWSVKTSSTASANVELSFSDVNSGGVSDMSSLRVAMLKNLVWEDAGNTGFTGSPGSSGSVISNPINSFDLPTTYFTLASTNNFTNPLPLHRINLFARELDGNTIIHWTIQSSSKISSADLQWTKDGKNFITVQSIQPFELNHVYSYQILGEKGAVGYYRVSALKQDGNKIESSNLLVRIRRKESLLIFNPTLNETIVTVQIYSKAVRAAYWCIYNNNGQLLRKDRLNLVQGYQEKKFDISNLSVGLYYLLLFDENGRGKPVKFIKQF